MEAFGTLVCPLLIGRDEFLDLADRRIAQVAAGKGQTLFVAGISGIGKSRLVRAIGHKAVARGFATADAALARQDLEVPAAAFFDLARGMSRDPAFAEVGRDLMALREELAQSRQRRRRVIVFDVVDRIAAAISRPTLLVFDDLQWADDLSLEILGELIRRLRDEPVLLLADYRTDEQPAGSMLREWRSRLLSQRLAEEVVLGSLTLEQVGLMTTLIVSSGLPAPRDAVQAIHERTDGVPLHIEELLGVLDADARLDGAAIRAAGVPETIEDAVLERIGKRSVEAQAAARAGAVLGRSFAIDVLAEIMDREPATLDAPLSELVLHNVLAPVGTTGLFDFRHQLLRDALYRHIPAGERRRLHALAADVGTRLGRSSDMHVSLHFERAGLREQAFTTAVAGARSAAHLSSHREAYQLYVRALENLPQAIDAAEHARLMRDFGREAGAVDENDAAEAAYAEAAAAFKVAGLPAESALALADQAEVQGRLGRTVAERVALVELAMRELDDADAEAVVPESVTAEARAGVLSSLAHTLLWGGRVADAVEAAELGRRQAERRAGARFDMELTIAMGDARLLGGEPDGWDALDLALRRPADGSTPVTMVWAYRDAAAMAFRLMDRARAERYIGDGIAHGDAVEQSYCRHILSSFRARMSAARGSWDEAAREGAQVLADRRGGVWAAVEARCAIGEAHLGRGALAEARVAYEDALAVGLGTERPGLIMPALWGLAETALLAGDAERAVSLARDALQRASPVGDEGLIAPVVLPGVRGHLARNRPEHAEAWLAEVRAVIGASTLPGCRTALRHGEGLVAAASGSSGSARAALLDAVRGWDDIGRVWEASWARLDLAAALLRVGQHAAAAERLLEVRATAEALGSRPLLERADELLRATRGRRLVADPWAPLSGREFEVARLIADGRTNAQIATALGISPRTAGSHVEHILAKLGADRRSEIATWVASVDARSGVPVQR